MELTELLRFLNMKNGIAVCGNLFTYILTLTQQNEIFQLVSLILSILVSVLIVISKIITWYKEAKKDGKIDTEEIKECIDIVEEGLEEIKKDIDKKEE